MKKAILLFLGIIASVVIFAQDHETRKGYIGIGMGVAIPHGDFGGDAGIQLNLMNAGYLFSKNVGVTATWFGVGFSENNNVRYTRSDGRYDDGYYYDTQVITLGGMMAGPMFSTSSANKRFDFDLRLQAGFGGGSLPSSLRYYAENETPITLALGAGTSLRWNCWRFISLSLNYDYYTSKPDFGGQIGKFDMSSSGITMGLNFRIK